jgi:hypothetical protein
MQPNKAKREKTIAERQKKEKELILEKFRRMPIVQIALDQTGVSRSSYYRWRDEDLEFKTDADVAIMEGETFITELSESKLLSLINKESFPAVQLWLRSHHSKYSPKLEINANIQNQEEALTPEQQKVVNEALRLLSISESNQEAEGDNSDETNP